MQLIMRNRLFTRYAQEDKPPLCNFNISKADSVFSEAIQNLASYKDLKVAGIRAFGGWS
jgi:hypothetical protein